MGTFARGASRVALVFLGLLVIRYATTSVTSQDQQGTIETSAVPATSIIESYPVGNSKINEEIKLPSGSIYESPAPLGDGQQRGFGWEIIKRTPGIDQVNDIKEVLKAPSVTYGENYNIVIGRDNQGNLIELVIIDNLIIRASGLEQYSSPSGDSEESDLDERDVYLRINYYKEHMESQDDHLNREEIGQTIENADGVYTGEGSNGQPVYIWRKKVGDEYYYVRGEDFGARNKVPFDEIRVRTAYESDEEKLEDLKETYDLKKIEIEGGNNDDSTE